MNAFRKIWSVVSYDTFGGIAASSFIICAFSGVALAIPYDVGQAYVSVSEMMLSNPAASFFRNLHYWSAQLFLIFTLIHVADHLVKKTEYDQRPALWLALTLSLIPLFFVMLSGFILKGDPDALQARQIFSSLLDRIPLAGERIRFSIMGPEASFQLLYVHHVATATILLFIVIYEHVDSFWPVNFRFLITTFILIVLSYLFSAPLHDGINPVMKGPWYFVGLQEILHWMSGPGWIWLALLLFLFLFFMLRNIALDINLKIKQLFILLVALYIVASVTGYFFRGENWRWETQKEAPLFFDFTRLSVLTPQRLGFEGELPVILDRKEGCIACHEKTAGMAASHDIQSAGCQACHRGDPFTLLKGRAHHNMERVPGNLSSAGRSCGNARCHPGVPHRVERSIMSTLAGMVTVDRYVFGESDTLDALNHIDDIGHTAADEHLRDLCAHCHIGHVKPDPGPVNQLSRGGGCTACHLNYSAEALAGLDRYLFNPEAAMADTFYHPSLDLDITSVHCFGCHSRSGRISTNYEGWHETLLEAIPAGDDGAAYRELDDRRIFRFTGSDVHYDAGMECVDCHLAQGVMGDGNLYLHQEQQVKISCEDCHSLETHETVTVLELDEESRKIARLREWNEPGREFLVTEAGHVIVNARTTDTGRAVLYLKNGRGVLPLDPPARACTKGTVHDALSCQSCHTAWAPQCIGCHNAYDPEVRGYDLKDRAEKEGSWVEFVGSYFDDKPSLGVIEVPGTSREIHTFVPGMILSIDRQSYPGNNEPQVFLRLFAPTSAHTTAGKGRSCRSCHSDPLALGFGRGELTFDRGEGKWRFTPRFAANRNDGLPEDAWTGFLRQREDQAATRYHMRPFDLPEQKRILTVGACLECHEETSEVMQQSLWGLEPLLEILSPRCRIPFKD